MRPEDTTPITNEANGQPEAAPEADAEADTVRESTQNEELLKVQKQALEYMEGWQRERADFNNYRKRVETQQKDSYQNASLELLKKLLPIVDDFERALGNVPPDMAEQPWLSGMTLINRKFQKILEEYGVETVDPVGQPFDPNRHEAVSTDESGTAESGQITATLQKGYVYGERILRPALVRVAR
ncbi:MAG TPA: nucleotide exchange factor GrpE [Phototrophicaceae bacterium]|nr:nucleotide exchange factor GrpE [Phototrophicaceae bacterium]